MTEIEKTEGEIKVLQAKLELLKEMENHKSPCEEAFKEVYGYYPEGCERSVWFAFQKGYETAQKDYKVGEYQPTPQEPEELKTLHQLDEVVDKLIKEQQAQKLYHRLYDELGYDFEDIENIVDLVEDWILDEQSSAGSQNLDTELLVEGFNDAIRKMKEMLR